MAETKAGGPFPEILQYDIFVNCILLTEVLAYLQNSPLPPIHTLTTWDTLLNVIFSTCLTV